MPNFNILSQRYATKEMNDIFSEIGKIRFERKFWIAVLKTQKLLGLDIPDEAIIAYEKAKEYIDLELIKQIELSRRHDVKARIEAFNIASGDYELIHMGMTSRDLTDNVEQMQIKMASQLIFGKYVAILKKFIERARLYDSIIFTARTHRQPAQLTLLGRRFAMWAEELLNALVDFEDFLQKYPLRGIKGPIGTQFDALSLLGDKKKVPVMERKIAEHLGFEKVIDAPGQVYSRSLDYKMASHLSLLSSACENFAKSIRLMSGHGLVTEGFVKGQVGSSAMPHKMNTRSSERISGFCQLLKMYSDGASRLSGDQWEEGDVSCSVVRRVIIPDVFYVSDGLTETTLTVLNEMGIYQNSIDREVETYLPFLVTTELLSEATKKGIGREKAHDIIKKYAVEGAKELRETDIEETDFIYRLGDDPEFPLDKDELLKILREKRRFIGNAKEQINSIVKKSKKLINKYSTEASYEPKPIL
jgi:adenylosuccinate lyase